MVIPLQTEATEKAFFKAQVIFFGNTNPFSNKSFPIQATHVLVLLQTCCTERQGIQKFPYRPFYRPLGFELPCICWWRQGCVLGMFLR